MKKHEKNVDVNLDVKPIQDMKRIVDIVAFTWDLGNLFMLNGK